MGSLAEDILSELEMIEHNHRVLSARQPTHPLLAMVRGDSGGATFSPGFFRTYGREEDNSVIHSYARYRVALGAAIRAHDASAGLPFDRTLIY